MLILLMSFCVLSSCIEFLYCVFRVTDAIQHCANAAAESGKFCFLLPFAVTIVTIIPTEQLTLGIFTSSSSD